MPIPIRKTTTLVALVPLAAAPTALGSLLFSQFGGTGAVLENSRTSQVSSSGEEWQTADDFSLTSTSSVRQIRFWGGFFEGPDTTIPSFNVLVYADAGGRPTGTPGNPTATALHSFTVSAASTSTGTLAPWAGFYGNNNLLYQYDIDLGAGFTATAGVTYWLVVQAAFDNPPRWAWAMQGVTSGASAHQAGSFFGFASWSDVGTESQFELFGATSGGAVPLPGAAGLAALGLVGLTRGRRR